LAKNKVARAEVKKDLLRRELVKAMDETVYARTVLKGMVDGKSKETIAEEMHLTPATVGKIQHKLVHEYKANFTTEVGFWVELLMARYNKLLEMLMPLAMNKEAQAIKFVLEIFEAQRALVGADAVDRQRQETVDSYKKKVQGEMTIAVYDSYKNMLKSVKPDPVETALIGEVINGNAEPAALLIEGELVSEGEGVAEEDESEENLYEDEDP